MKRLMLAVLGLVLASCGIGGGPYHKKDGMWFFENEHMRVPDGEKVEALNNRFARTKTLAFYRSSIIDGADVATFQALSEDYAKDKSRVWYASTYRKGQEYFSIVHTSIVELSGADPASFVSLDTPHAENDLRYAKDKAHVWFEGELMNVADVAGFQPLSYGYARDNTTGYYMRQPVPDSDGKTFTNLGNEWAKDATHVWWSDVVIGAQSPGTIVNRVAEGADPATFNEIDSGYGKDRAGVFFHGVAVKGADPATFVVRTGDDGSDAVDSTGRYQEGKRMRVTLPAATPAEPAAEDAPAAPTP